jgi:hypothetical protein
MPIVIDNPNKINDYYSIIREEYSKRELSSQENSLNLNVDWNSNKKYLEIYNTEKENPTSAFLAGKYTPSIMKSLYGEFTFGHDLPKNGSSQQPYDIQKTDGTLINNDVDSRRYEKGKLSRILKNQNLANSLNTISNTLGSLLPTGISDVVGTVSNIVTGKVGSFDMYGIKIQPYILMIDSLSTGLSISTGQLNSFIQSPSVLGANPLWSSIGSPRRAVNSQVHNVFAGNGKGIHKGLPIETLFNLQGALNAAQKILAGENVAGTLYDLIGVDVPGFNFTFNEEDKEKKGSNDEATDTIQSKWKFNKIDVPNKNMIKYYSVLSYGQISLLQDKRKISSLQSDKYTDFREDIQDKSATFITRRKKFNRYTYLNPTNFFGMADTGQPGLDRSDPTKMHKKELHTYDVFTHDEIILDKDGVVDPNVSLGKKYQDYIKFVIHDIYNRETIRIRATITDVSDSVTPNWENVEYVGKADPLFVHRNTTRKFNFGFTMAALSRYDLFPMWKKINKLMGLMYPTYVTKESYDATVQNFNGNYTGSLSENASSKNNITSTNSINNSTVNGKNIVNYTYNLDRPVSPFIYFTLGDWFDREPGFLTDLSITADNDTPWDINVEGLDDAAQLPHIIKITTGFQPLGKSLYQNPNSSMKKQINFFGWKMLNNQYYKAYGASPREKVGNVDNKLQEFAGING